MYGGIIYRDIFYAYSDTASGISDWRAAAYEQLHDSVVNASHRLDYFKDIAGGYSEQGVPVFLPDTAGGNSGRYFSALSGRTGIIIYYGSVCNDDSDAGSEHYRCSCKAISCGWKAGRNGSNRLDAAVSSNDSGMVVSGFCFFLTCSPCGKCLSWKENEKNSQRRES